MGTDKRRSKDGPTAIGGYLKMQRCLSKKYLWTWRNLVVDIDLIDLGPLKPFASFDVLSPRF